MALNSILLKFSVFHERFKLWSTGNREIQSLRGEERLHVEEVEVVVVDEVRQQLVS